jgi:superfamily I DNA/RNA helicase
VREGARWKHILLDEYQDVNRAGARLIQLLYEGGANCGPSAMCGRRFISFEAHLLRTFPGSERIFPARRKKNLQ